MIFIVIFIKIVETNLVDEIFIIDFSKSKPSNTLLLIKCLTMILIT